MTLGRAAALVASVGAATLLGALGLRGSAPDAAASGPVLVVRAPLREATRCAPRPDADERAAALVAASLSPADHRHVLELIDFATARLEAQLSPLGTDFDDGEPVEQLRKSLQPYVPLFNAAHEIDRSAWLSDDLDVRIAASCAAARPSPEERCVPLHDPPGAPPAPSVPRRARFLAWAVSHARVVEAGTRSRAEACARTLRARATEALSPIALVLLADDLALRPAAEPSDLQAAAVRLGRALIVGGKELPKDLEAFSRRPREETVAPWLALSKSQVLVIPRLSALSRPLTLDCEVRPAGL